MTRKESIDEQSVYSDDKSRDQSIQDKEERYGNSFVHSVGVLESVVAEGKVLVVWFDGIESVEGEEENS